MEFTITDRSGSGFTRVTTSHKGESISWLVKFYSKVILSNADDVFAGINGYLATLPEITQDAIFELYKEIKETIDETLDGADMVDPIRGCVKDLYQMIPMDHLRLWIMHNYPIYVPELKDEVEETDRYNNRDETYIKADYYDLIVFSMATRFMIPIWGEYITQGGAGHGSDLYKEADALALVSGTELMAWPKSNGTPGSMPVKEKLLRYIEIKADRMLVSLSDLLQGISSSDVPSRLLATVILRRLTIVPLTLSIEDKDNKNIVANLHHYIDQRLRPQDKRAGSVTPKMKDSEGRDEDDKTSVFEQYKIRQKVPDGDVVAFEVDALRTELLIQKADPSIDLNLLRLTSRSLPDLENTLASKHQLTLAQWALARAFPARAFDDVSLRAVNHLLVTAQALYWHWGLYDIAILLTVSKVNLSDVNTPGLSPLPKPTSRFKPEILEDFMTFYPHFFPQSGKDAKDVKGNVAFIGVSTVLQEMFEASWYYKGSQKLFALSNQDPSQKTIIVQTSIRQSLYEAVKKIVSLNQ